MSEIKTYPTAASINLSLASGREVIGVLQIGGHELPITAYRVTMRGVKGPWGRVRGSGRWMPLRDAYARPCIRLDLQGASL